MRPLTTWAPGSTSPLPRPVTSSPVPTPADGTPPPTTGPGDGLPRTPTPSPTIIADAWGCVADLTVTSQWPGGFVATVKVRNLNGFFPVETWTVDVHVPGGEVTGAWNATRDGSTPGRFTPAPWSPRVGYSGTAEFGLQATGAPGSTSVTCRPGF